jgi:hypothetical protein
VVDAVPAVLASKTPEALALPFMKWARSEGAKFFLVDCKTAAKMGHTETLKWLVEEGDWREDKDAWREEVVLGAAEGGHLDILQWAKDQGFLSVLLANDKYLVELVQAAIEGGLEILKCVISEKPDILRSIPRSPILLCLSHSLPRNQPRTDSDGESLKIARRETFEMVKYLRNLGADWDSVTFRMLAQNGDLEALKWARKHGCPWEAPTCASAALNGRFDILKWARKHKCPWDSSTCSAAALSGNFEILKWAREHGCPWESSICSYAAHSGNLEMMKWAREHESPWNGWTCFNAAHSGNFELLKWVHEHGCPWDESTCVAATKIGNFEMITWAREHGCPWNKSMCYEAIRRNHIDILDWAFTNGCPCKPAKLFRYAAEVGNLYALNWVKKKLHGEEAILSTYSNDIKHLRVISWLRKDGMLFPEDFPAIAKNNLNVSTLVLLVLEKLPAEFSQMRREMEAAWEVSGQTWTDLFEASKKVLKGVTNAEDFCRMVLENWGGR